MHRYKLYELDGTEAGEAHHAPVGLEHAMRAKGQVIAPAAAQETREAPARALSLYLQCLGERRPR